MRPPRAPPGARQHARALQGGAIGLALLGSSAEGQRRQRRKGRSVACMHDAWARLASRGVGRGGDGIVELANTAASSHTQRDPRRAHVLYGICKTVSLIWQFGCSAAHRHVGGRTLRASGKWARGLALPCGPAIASLIYAVQPTNASRCVAQRVHLPPSGNVMYHERASVQHEHAQNLIVMLRLRS